VIGRDEGEARSGSIAVMRERPFLCTSFPFKVKDEVVRGC
jgi:hypothetical protein